MKLGELRTSLNRYSRDLDELEVVVQYVENDKRTYDLLAFVGYHEDFSSAVLGTVKAAKQMIKDGKIKDQNGKN
jgi:hypothetical protein